MSSCIPIVVRISKEHDVCGEDNLLDERIVNLGCSVKSTLVLLAVSLSVFLFVLWGEGEL